MEEVSLEELEALKEKTIQYESIIQSNKEKEQELEELKQQTAALEAKIIEPVGEGRGK